MNVDDGLYVTANPLVRAGLGATTARQAFTTLVAGNWHPLTTLSHLLDARLFGLAPGPHHLHNLLLHLVNTVLLFFLLSRLTGARWRSAFVAAVFALHPLHVESVAWVSERKDLLSSLFGLASLAAYAAYTRRPGPRRMAWVVGFAALGLLAKPMLVTLPFLLLLLDFWPLGRTRAWGALVAEKIPLFALTAVFSAIAVFAQARSSTVQGLEAYPLGVRLGNAAVSAIAYLAQTLWPAGLAFFYPHPGTGLSTGLAWLAAAALVVISALAFRLRRTQPYLAVGWLWYLGMLVPVLGLVQLGEISRADRYTYLSLTGVLVGAAWGLDALVRDRSRASTLLGVAGAGAVAALSVACWFQIGTWRNTEALFTRAIAVTRDNVFAHYNLGQVSAAQGRVAEAAWHYAEAVRIKPYFAQPHSGLGLLAFDRGDYAEAARHFGLASQLDAAAKDPPYNLGISLERLGRYPEAAAAYRDALRLDPGMVDALLGLGRVLVRSGRPGEALEPFRAALRVDPGSGEARHWVEFLSKSPAVAAPR